MYKQTAFAHNCCSRFDAFIANNIVNRSCIFSPLNYPVFLSYIFFLPISSSSDTDCCFFLFFFSFSLNRREVKVLRNETMAPSVNNKERLTIDWFTQAIAEIRGELAEIQEVSSNTTLRLQQRNQCAEDILELREDFDKLKLEFSSMRLRQESLDQSIRELQAETIQREEDIRRVHRVSISCSILLFKTSEICASIYKKRNKANCFTLNGLILKNIRFNHYLTKER